MQRDDDDDDDDDDEDDDDDDDDSEQCLSPRDVRLQRTIVAFSLPPLPPPTPRDVSRHPIARRCENDG